jgi:hypothetical protein
MKENPEKNESPLKVSLSIYVPASTLPARSIASATVDEDMNFMTKMRKNSKDGSVDLVDSISSENRRSFIRYYIEKRNRKPKR